MDVQNCAARKVLTLPRCETMKVTKVTETTGISLLLSMFACHSWVLDLQAQRK